MARRHAAAPPRDAEVKTRPPSALCPPILCPPAAEVTSMLCARFAQKNEGTSYALSVFRHCCRGC